MKDSVYYDEFFEDALKCFKKGEIQRAEDLANQLLEGSPKHGNTWNLLAVIAWKKGILEAAIERIGKAMQYNPKRAPIFACNLALIYIQQGNIPAAIHTYGEAAAVFERQKQTVEAVECLEKASQLLSEKELDVARELYEKILILDGKNTLALNDLGLVFFHERKFDKAKEFFEKAIQINPKESCGYNNLAILYQQEGRYHEAIALYESALSHDPDSIETHINLSHLYNQEQNFEKAVYHAQKAREIHPHHPGVYNNLGIVYHSQGKIHEAVEQFKKALEIDENFEEAEKNLQAIAS